MSPSLQKDLQPDINPAPAWLQHSQAIYSTAAHHAQHCASQIQAISSAHQQRLTNHLQQQHQRLINWAGQHITCKVSCPTPNLVPLAATASHFGTAPQQNLQGAPPQQPWWINNNASRSTPVMPCQDSSPPNPFPSPHKFISHTGEASTSLCGDSSNSSVHSSLSRHTPALTLPSSNTNTSPALDRGCLDNPTTQHESTGPAYAHTTATGSTTKINGNSRSDKPHTGTTSSPAKKPTTAHSHASLAVASPGPDNTLFCASINAETVENCTGTAASVPQNSTASIHLTPISPASIPHSIDISPHASVFDMAPSPWGQGQATGGLQHEDKKAELGRATWLLLHTLAAQYPDSPTRQQQKDVRTMIDCLTRVYPCGDCATHFAGLVR